MKIEITSRVPQITHVLMPGQILDCPEGYARKLIRHGKARAADAGAGAEAPEEPSDAPEAPEESEKSMEEIMEEAHRMGEEAPKPKRRAPAPKKA
ncbi:MAG: hypothetical protein IJ083_03305 [Clostridia bacterium]|nr:hypothetical protein [Clostridia bacterium]